MALVTNESYSSVSQGAMVRVIPRHVEVSKFGAGTGTLAPLTPLGYDDVNEVWGVWTALTAEINTITANATTATDGTFTISVNGETTTALDHDAVDSVIEAALIALNGVRAGDVGVVDSAGGLAANNGIATITWGGRLAAQDISIQVDMTGITGNAHVLADSVAGVDANGRHVVKGFVYPDPVVLAAGGEVLAQVLKMGDLRYDDIVLPAGESQSVLDEALKDGPQARGLVVKGLAGVR